MPRLVEYDAESARRIDKAIKEILAGSPTDAELKLRARKGRLRLNFATVSQESGVPRHLFDEEKGIYPEQYAAIVAAMPKKGESEPLAMQIDRIRVELADTHARLGRSETYAANLLTRMHLLELEIARLREENATLGGDGGEAIALIGSGELIGLPPSQPRRPPPQHKAFGKGRKRA